MQQFTRARDRLLEVTASDSDLGVVLDAVVAALHDVSTFSWCAIMPVDPQTLLPTAGVVEGFSPDTCAPFWDHELLVPGFNKFNVLARSTETVATLIDATDGDLDRAPIYANVYAPLGVADELRAAFVLGSTCWGIAVMVRAIDDGPFPDSEVEAVRSLSPFIARAMRAGACKLDAAASGPAAMIVVDRRNQITSLTVRAKELLEDLRTAGVNEPGLPATVATAATRARSSRTSTHFATRVRGTSGRWLRVTAAPMDGDEGSVAVMIEPARAADLTPILLESYGLTKREADIVMMLARGLATKQIASELSLSSHTVRDHVKAIFEKAGVNSRGELAARLFSEHMKDAFEGSIHRVS
jgi:DNA-binding CsgD family transcriptional regulator